MRSAALVLLVAASCTAFGPPPETSSSVDAGPPSAQPPDGSTATTSPAADAGTDASVASGCAPAYLQTFDGFNPEAGADGFTLSGGPPDSFKIETRNNAQVAVFRADKKKTSRSLARDVNRPCRTVVRFKLWSAMPVSANQRVVVFSATIRRPGGSDEQLDLRMLPTGFRLWGAGASESLNLTVPEVWHDIAIELEENGRYTLQVGLERTEAEGSTGALVAQPLQRIVLGITESTSEAPAEIWIKDLRIE